MDSPAARMGDSKRRRTRRLSGEGERVQVSTPLAIFLSGRFAD
jgi:hypothetical protein